MGSAALVVGITCIIARVFVPAYRYEMYLKKLHDPAAQYDAAERTSLLVDYENRESALSPYLTILLVVGVLLCLLPFLL